MYGGSLSIQVSFFNSNRYLFSRAEGNWKGRRGSKETTGLYVVHLDRHLYFRFNFILKIKTRVFPSFRMDDFLRHSIGLSCRLPTQPRWWEVNGFFFFSLLRSTGPVALCLRFFHSFAFSVWLSVGSVCMCVCIRSQVRIHYHLDGKLKALYANDQRTVETQTGDLCYFLLLRSTWVFVCRFIVFETMYHPF